MFPIKTLIEILLILLFTLTACSPAGDSFATQTDLTSFPQPTATAIQVLPTPSSPGDPVIWRGLKVKMTQTEMTDGFINEFGSQRDPSAGQKFLWVHVALENVGVDEIPLPEPENFSVLYAESEFKPVYGHRQGYADYTDTGDALFPGQALDAWLRFDIPVSAELQDLWFVFLPTSVQVGASPSSPHYPYAENKRTFVWKCTP
jgi:hypothetical protein